MCGIVGYSLRGQLRDSSELILRMTRRVSHRGPDDEGLVFLEESSQKLLAYATTVTDQSICERLPQLGDNFSILHKVAIGHRRFAIIDLSGGGHQPYVSDDGTVAVAFNGEIYDYVEVRRELEKAGFIFRSNSDLEVFAKAYEFWGEACFSRLNGFWAAAVVDARRQTTILCRDRLGKAPLYIASTEVGIFWASEIEGIFEACPALRREISLPAVWDYLRFGRRDAGFKTLFASVHSVPAGSLVSIDSEGNVSKRVYWTLPEVRRAERDCSIDASVFELRKALESAVSQRLRADVPIALELSGGVDSSSIAALAAHLQVPVTCYAVDYSDSANSEVAFASEVANRHSRFLRLRIINVEEHITAQNIAGFVEMMGEPFHSPGIFVHHRLWCRMADEGFRVTINGAGGDEVFAGYLQDYWALYIHELVMSGRFGKAAHEIAHLSERGESGVAPVPWARLLRGAAQQWIPSGLTEIIASRYYGAPLITIPREARFASRSLNFNETIATNMGDGLMNYWLRSGNQSFMRVPIELRCPLLDYRVVELAFRMPTGYLIRDGWLKWILRKAVEDILPEAIVWRRRKMGFPFPLTRWLYCEKEQLLRETRGANCPFVSEDEVRRRYVELLERRPYLLWRLLCFLIWWKRVISRQ